MPPRAWSPRFRLAVALVGGPLCLLVPVSRTCRRPSVPPRAWSSTLAKMANQLQQLAAAYCSSDDKSSDAADTLAADQAYLPVTCLRQPRRLPRS